MSLSCRHLLSAYDIQKDDLQQLFELAEEFRLAKQVGSELPRRLPQGLLGALFFEPSTRTRLSTETAMIRLGGDAINIIGMDNSSLKKGETLYDTGKMVGSYVDIIAMRHAEKGAVAELAKGSDVPVINCGDGPGEHPTQSLVDFYTIKHLKGEIDGLEIALVGDLKYGRTVHSLIKTFRHFSVSYRFVAPDALQMPNEYCQFLDEQGITYTKTEDLAEGIAGADVIYDTRIQQERFASEAEFKKYHGVYEFTPVVLENVPNAILLHPFPRLGEIDPACDELPQAHYFTQVKLSVFIRMALIYLMLDE